jgi:hypothetical protein
MKTVFALILVFALFDATALEIQVSRMKKISGYSERYDLKTSLDEKVVLDCQSFIQGLLFGPVGESAIMLEEWQCDELTQEMKKSMSQFKKHCLEVDRDRAVLDSQHACP